jgi:hypothetical protein
MTLTWDYSHRTIDISMPGYVKKSLDRFQHHAHGRPQNSPHTWQRTQYGKHPQMTPYFDDSTILPPSELTRIQEIVGTFLFYGRASKAPCWWRSAPSHPHNPQAHTPQHKPSPSSSITPSRTPTPLSVITPVTCASTPTAMHLTFQRHMIGADLVVHFF